MKARGISGWGWIGVAVVVAVAAPILLLSCGPEKPAAPLRSNPLDGSNPETNGDPFHLTVLFRPESVGLFWQIPAGPAIAHFSVLRRADRAGAFVPRVSNLAASITTWSDEQASPGHTYEYKVVALDAAGRPSAESLVAAVRVDMLPLLRLTGDAVGPGGVVFVKSPSVKVKLRALTATHRKISVGADPSGVAWEAWSPRDSSFTFSPGALMGEDGPKTISCKVKYDDGDSSGVLTSELVLDRAAPVAKMDTTVVSHLRQVTVDASATRDPGDLTPAGSLRFRWSWGDGLTSDYSTTPTAEHRYTGPGPFWVRLEAVDVVGWVGKDSVQVPLTNGAPSAPMVEYPPDGADSVAITADLRWTASADPESDAVHYRLYFGTGNVLRRVASDLTTASYDPPDDLAYDTRYSWKVTAVGVFEDSTAAGPWSFAVIDPPGACCAANGTCAVTLQAACTAPSTWTMFGVCNPNPCTQGMILVPVGPFTMGSPTSEPGRGSGEIQHQVTLTKSFYMSDHEVTQSEWRSVMGTSPSSFTGDNLPVESVGWLDCIDYCNRRSAREGLDSVYTRTGTTVTWDQSKNGYRLPTEAEWEYACRAGQPTAFWNGAITNTRCSPVDPNLNLVGWYCGNAGSTTHAVKGKLANGSGLYDMHGNVWEWCWDWYQAYSGAVTNPTGPASGSYRVRRGGGWGDYALYCRSAYRGGYTPNSTSYDLGLRLSRTAP